MPRALSTAVSLAVFVAAGAVPRAQDRPAAQPWQGLLPWRQLGPANMGGRITDIAVDERDPSRFWLATASAGLLKTTNNGITFSHQFGHQPTASVGAVAVAASDANVVWVGTGESNPRNSVSYGDGVYKSVDGGETWQHMGLRESFQIGDIVIHPTDPDVVWVGALGRLYGANEERGLYKTTDGGKTWERTLFVDEHTGVIDIALHPADPDVLLVATYERQRDGFDTNDPAKKWGPGSGLHRSEDGGRTFTKVTAGLPTVTWGRVGLDWYRKDPNVVYAIIESEMIGKPGAKVGWPGLRGEDAETGAKLTEVDEGGPAAKAGLQPGDIVLSVAGTTVLSYRALLTQLARHEVGETVTLELARKGESKTVALELGARPDPQPEASDNEDEESGGERPAPPRRRRGDPERPFGAFLGGQTANIHELQGKDGHEHGGVYRSADAGKTWTRINSINPRPMYFSEVRVDPSDETYQWVLGVSLARSADRGATYTEDGGRGVHSDHHAMWIDPRDGRHVILGGDGGVWVTYDRGAHWDHLNHMALGQFYHVAVGPRRDYWVYGGLQDNGTWGAPHRSASASGVVNEDWLRIGGGDGFVVAVDREDPDQIYYESQNGGTGRTNLRTMEGGRIRPRAPRGVRYRFNWRTPFILSAHNSRVYYCAGNHVFRSWNRGDDLKSISPDITRTDRGSATAVAESPRDPDVLYVGTDDGALWMTRDGGRQWLDLWVISEEVGAPEAATTGSSGGPRAEPPAAATEPASLAELTPGPRWVSSIEPSRHETGRVYLTLDAHRSDDDDPYVFVSEDFGKTWRSLRANLPRGSTRVVREDRTDPRLLYLGTEFGMWVSLDRGGEWLPFHGSRGPGDLPTVAVHEIAQHESCGDVVVATHGRSLWAVDVTPLRQLAAAGDGPLLLDPADVVVWERRHRRATSGARTFFGDNPGSDALIFYRLGDGAREVGLRVESLGGELLRELETSAAAGLHRAAWDLRRAGPPDGERRFRRSQSVPAGTYRAVLTVDGQSFSQEFEVLAEPGATSR